jgi:Zn-dependent M16 (insulinase) family peptidase
MKSALDAVGQNYKEFVVTKCLPLYELQSTLLELVHEPTGARVLHIANNDPENLFCLSFQTLPSSSNGVAHILEHTVLCGSKKFPIKDPFFAMTRRSLNTYMNALTGQDFTCYPASSQVEKDFYNLLEVYLDAAFHPQLKKVSFLQEGHRLEFVDPKNPDGPLQYQGVVYNEMKGAMSSSESRLWQAISKRLTPDLSYAYNSGGEPSVIPSLTFEELREFHQNFYHPSRCLFFFYGNLPLSQHLDFIAEKTLEGTTPIAPLPPLPLQKRFSAPVFAVDSYPIAEAESPAKKTQIAFTWLTASMADQTTTLALSLIDSILADTDASPLKLAFLKSGLCTQLESSLDIEMSEVPWAIICKGCEEKDADSLRKLLFATLEEAALKPFPPEEIEASLHQLEFHRTEIGMEGVPFGLTLFLRAGLIKQQGSEPENALLIHTLFNELRARVADPTYLSSLIRKYLIDNPHFVQLIFKPDPHLEKEERAEEEKRLLAIQAHLDEKKKREISKQTAELAAYQEEVENQSLDCLPKVTLHDVPLHARDFPLSELSLPSMSVLHHACFTNQILYADLVFDLPDLPLEQFPLFSLFVRLLPELGCGGRSYAENLAYQQAYVGEFEASFSLHVTHEDPNVCNPSFSIRGKALRRNSEKLFDLLVDVVLSTDFNDRERIQEWLLQHATELESQLTKNALNYAIQTSLSGFSTASLVFDLCHGLPYYRAVLRWAKHLDDAFFKDLKQMQSLILGLKKPQLVLCCDQDHFNHLKESRFYDLEKKLPHRAFSPWKGNYPLPKIESHLRPISSPVAFTASGFRTISYNQPQAPLLFISTELLENLVLHKEIREKGGAYGGGVSYSPSTGNFYFYAYRDPHLSKTIEAFQKALEKIADGEFNERELEEAKLGVIQALDAPVAPGTRAMVAYSWKRAGRTLALREDFRKKILSATSEEVAEAMRHCLIPHPRVLISLLGQELINKEKKKLHLPLLPIEL